MGKITPNKQQEEAIKLAKAWWADSTERNNRPFVLAGYAGTGKTTSLKLILEELGIDYGEYISISFTGKAATVLRKNGYLASTIHRFIYDVVPLRGGKFKFELKSEIPTYKLVVVDEVGQVSKELFDDLKHFGLPILVMGDPFQTRQIGGTDNGLLDKPDIVLTEVMRQALDNPILYLATQIRQGQRIQYGTYGEELAVLPRQRIPLETYGHADQIITTTNRTVTEVNHLVRGQVYGLDGVYPYVGEKLMILKNDWSQTKFTSSGIELSPVNGLTVIVREIGDYDHTLRTFDIKVEDIGTGIRFDKMKADAVYFEDGLRDDSLLYEDPEYKALLFRRKAAEDTKDIVINKMTYGYCTTTYKAQGSEYDNVVYIKDRYHCPNEDYTSVTRASKKLIIGI